MTKTHIVQQHSTVLLLGQHQQNANRQLSRNEVPQTLALAVTKVLASSFMTLIILLQLQYSPLL
jgi:hypothetical protein